MWSGWKWTLIAQQLKYILNVDKFKNEIKERNQIKLYLHIIEQCTPARGKTYQALNQNVYK